MGKAKGVKMGLGDFIGNTTLGGTDVLPNAPRERDPDDDGRFKRVEHRRDGDGGDGGGGYGGDNSRSEQDGAWRSRSTSSTTNAARPNRESGNSRFTDPQRSDSSGRFVSDDAAPRTTFRSSSSMMPATTPAPATRAPERTRLNLSKRTIPNSSPTKITDTQSSLQRPPSEPQVSQALYSTTTSSSQVNGHADTSLTQNITRTEPTHQHDEAEADSTTIVASYISQEDVTPTATDTTNMTNDKHQQPTGPKFKNHAEGRRDVHQPNVVNLRAAALMDTTDHTDRGGPPHQPQTRSFRNKEDHQSLPSPPLEQNSRFSAAAASDPDYVGRGDRTTRFTRTNRDESQPNPPPQVQNSRFAAAAAADREYTARTANTHKDDTPPPPHAPNSRFAAVVAADREYKGGFNRTNTNHTDETSPPPQVQNSRFAAAAAADRDYTASSGGAGFRSSRRSNEELQQQPPLEVQNSRFAAAAAADRDYTANSSGFRSSSRRNEQDENPATRTATPPRSFTNTRFAAAIQADTEYRDRGERADFDRNGSGPRGDRQGGEDRRGGASSQDSSSRFDQRRSSGGGDNRYNTTTNNNHSHRGDRSEPELPRHPSSSNANSSSISAADFPSLFKPATVAALLPKSTLPPPVSVPIALPGEDEDAARARIDKKKKETDEKKAAEMAEHKRKEEELLESKKQAAEAAEKARAAETDLLEMFASGEAGDGEELKKWCKDQGNLLPPVEKLVCTLLIKQQQGNDTSNHKQLIECSWARPDQFGTALLALVENKMNNQIGVLVGVQFYCETIGFPKLGEEAVVQAMFRAIYKYDLAEADAFFEWKEDESKEHQRGKQKCIIQTVDWFNWLEEDEDDGEEEEEEEEEE